MVFIIFFILKKQCKIKFMVLYWKKNNNSGTAKMAQLIKHWA